MNWRDFQFPIPCDKADKADNTPDEEEYCHVSHVCHTGDNQKKVGSGHPIFEEGMDLI